MNGPRASRLLACLLPALFSAGCLARPHLTMPVEEVRSRVHTVCLDSIQSNVAFEHQQERVATFDRILLQEATRTGWKIVEPEPFLALAKRVTADAGGAYDPLTGEKDVAAADAIAAKIRNAAKAELGCDAFLDPALVVVTASWGEYGAGWDGVRQAMGATGNAYGHVPALSLRLRLLGMDGEELFYGTGGVQVLSRLERSGFLQRDFVDVSEENLLANKAHLFAASRAALQPFLPSSPR